MTPSRRKIVDRSAFVIAGLWLIVSVPAAWARSAAVDSAIRTLDLAAGGPLRVQYSASTGLATFIAATQPAHAIMLRVASTAPASARALDFVALGGAAIGVDSIHDVEIVRSSGPDEVGMEHVRLRQARKGVPVRGAEFTVHLRGARVVAVNAATLPGLEQVESVPRVDAQTARAAAMDLMHSGLGVSDAVLSEPSLEIIDPEHLQGRLSTARLAWFIEARAFAVREWIWIDAQKGTVAFYLDQLTRGRERHVFSAENTSNLPGTLVRSEGDPASGNSDVDHAYDFSGDTYDYFLSEHGRDSYDDAGAPLISTTHYCDVLCPFSNAFWDGTQMVYGEGFSAADDVDAHELTHAVTEHSSNLIYCLQPGALNESFSDIFGETVDLTNSGGNDDPGVRWLLGEDVPGFGAIRNMATPGTFGDPEKVGDPNFQCSTSCNDLDGGGVHTNSGVPNHAYALMVDGGSFNGHVVNGIGLVKSGKIQYRALTNYLTMTSSFSDDYLALQQACSDLVGVAGITLDDCTEVKNALDAVEMGGEVCPPPPFCGDGTLDAGELCDDGNPVDGDGCDGNCTPTSCGNGVVTFPEACDDGNLVSQDGCEVDCTLSEGCRQYFPSDLPQSILDYETVTSTVSVDLLGIVDRLRIQRLRGTHTYVGDLSVRLRSPSGTEVFLLGGACGSADDFELSLADEATEAITCPLTDRRTHRPMTPLATFYGEPSAGPWTLSVSDSFGGDTGVLQEWSLLLCSFSPDSDGDGYPDPLDDCPLVFDPDQDDLDHDGLGDACDERDVSLSLQYVRIVASRSLDSPRGTVSFRGETLDRSGGAALDPTGGIALQLRDHLALDAAFSWTADECRTSSAGVISCRVRTRDRSGSIKLRPLRSLVAGAQLFQVTGKVSRLPLNNPFLAPITLTIAANPGEILRGVDRVGATADCASSATGTRCQGNYGAPSSAFLGGPGSGILD